MTPTDSDHLIEEAAALWKESRSAVAFTGAGFSVPSGIPDFRSPGGLWTRYDPFEVATAQALDSNPKGVWEFMLETVQLLEKAAPNPAHLALADLEKGRHLTGVITQNIDNLHQEAGSRVVVEYHGNFKRFYCQNCAVEKPLSEVHALTLEANTVSVTQGISHKDHSCECESQCHRARFSHPKAGWRDVKPEERHDSSNDRRAEGSEFEL